MTVTQLEYSVLMPLEAINLVLNPSFEINLNNWTFSNCTTNQDSNNQTHGTYSCAVLPTSAGTDAKAYTLVPLVSGTSYTFSLDISGHNISSLSIYFETTGGVQKGTPVTLVPIDTYFNRYSVTWQADASATFRVVVKGGRSTTSQYFYMDGVQVEAGIIGSTYFDGDSMGFITGRKEFAWLGTPHASQSWRSGQTRAGGTELRIKNYARILTISGLSMPNLDNVAIPSNLGGSIYQNTILRERSISMLLAITGNNPGELQVNRAILANAFSPDLTGFRQPFILRYTGLAADNSQATEIVDIPVLYSGGLEGNTQNPVFEKLPIQLSAYDPYIRLANDRGAQVFYQATVINANYILQKQAQGVYDAMGTGLTGGGAYSMVRGLDGYIYAGGAFTQAGGVANTAYIAYWNGTTWAAMGTGMNGIVYCVRVGPDGSIYAGGAFTLAGGVANTVNIAYWDGAAWNPLGTGMNGTVYDIQFSNGGSVFACGDFTTAGGGAAARIAQWNGAAWIALSTGLNDTGYSMAYLGTGNLCVGGKFTTAGGTTVNYVTKWNGTTFSALSSGMNAYVRSICGDGSGGLYCGGNFTLASAIPDTAYIAKWNGSTWIPLSTGANGRVDFVSLRPDGNLLALGVFTIMGGKTLYDGMAQWSGSNWFGLDFDAPGGSAAGYSAAWSSTGDMFISFSTTGSAICEATGTYTNPGNGKTSPRFVFTGPGVLLQITNLATGESMYFDLTILAGETITLNCQPDQFSFKSSFNRNIITNILPGSVYGITLIPGVNPIEVFVGGTVTAATTARLSFRVNYMGIDGAKR